MEKEQRPLQFLHKYEIAEHPNKNFKNVKVLVKDETLVRCHKVPVAILHGQIEGQLIKDYELCSTHCSRAMLAAQDGVLFFCQNCESSPNKFQVENAKAESPILRTI
jgi:hypothetical protein